MNNQRIKSRAFFYLKDAGNGCGIGRISAKAVHGFRRERDEPAIFQDASGLLDWVDHLVFFPNSMHSQRSTLNFQLVERSKLNSLP